MDDSQTQNLVRLQYRGQILTESKTNCQNVWGRIDDVLKVCLWNLVYSIFDPGQQDLSKC